MSIGTPTVWSRIIPSGVARYYHPMEWEFGIGIGFPTVGTALLGWWCVRPLTVFVGFGPWTWECKWGRDVDININ